MTKPLDDSWQRYPEARVRMREDSIPTILKGLGEDGFCIDAGSKVRLVDEGIYVEILLNVGEHGSIVALPIDVLVPAEIPSESSKKKSKKKNKEVEEEIETEVVQELQEQESSDGDDDEN